MTVYPSGQARRTAALIGIALQAAFCCAWAEPPGTARQQELLHLLQHDCGSCHGMSLNGGLGPALTVDALRHKSDRYLAATILEGRPQQAMPPWEGILSEDEVDWLVTKLKVGLDNE